LSSGLSLPFLKELIEGRLDYGTSLLVEFEPDSIWYETSLTLAAHALKDGVRTDYHLFQHMPSEVRDAFTRFGLDVKQLEEQDSLRILDSYTVQTGLGLGETSKSHVSLHYSQSLKLSDWSIADVQRIKSGVPEEDKRRLHIDDNTGVLLQYNDEKSFIDNWRTRHRPHTKVQEIVMFNSLMKGAASDAFTRQFELLSDAIIDIKSQEKEGRIEHVLRVRAMRGRPYESRWRRLRLLQTSEVALAD
jgi:KaiC/GvpD/RAD55 family RecA-like ATPase